MKSTTTEANFIKPLKIIINMRIEIYTTNPENLKSKIFEKAKSGELSTWKLRNTSNKEKRLTHKGQWKDKAILKLIANPTENKLSVNIRWWEENDEPDDATKGIYLGRFSEALLNHFNRFFTSFETFYK